MPQDHLAPPEPDSPLSARVSPLLAPGGPLDKRQREVLLRVAEAEHRQILELPSDAILDPKRRARDAATYPELVDQPAKVKSTLRRNDGVLAELARELAREINQGRIDRVFLAGAGDSYAVMSAARSALETMLGVPCEPAQSLELAYYLAPLISPRSAVVTLSSSGETTRTVEATLVAQALGARTIAITNSAGSSLDQEASRTLLVDATRVGWPTQSSTTALALLLDLAIRVGNLRRVAQAKAWARTMEGLPGLMTKVLASVENPLWDIAEVEYARQMYLFSAAGPSWGSAVIGAAKVKECTPRHAEVIGIEEFHHYNSLKATEPIWIIAPAGLSVPRAAHTAAEAKRFGGQVYAITTEGVDAFDAIADRVIALPAVPEPLSPLLTVLPAQLVGYCLAMAQFRQAEDGDDV